MHVRLSCEACSTHERIPKCLTPEALEASQRFRKRLNNQYLLVLLEAVIRCLNSQLYRAPSLGKRLQQGESQPCERSWFVVGVLLRVRCWGLSSERQRLQMVLKIVHGNRASLVSRHWRQWWESRPFPHFNWRICGWLCRFPSEVASDESLVLMSAGKLETSPPLAETLPLSSWFGQRCVIGSWQDDPRSLQWKSQRCTHGHTGTHTETHRHQIEASFSGLLQNQRGRFNGGICFPFNVLIYFCRGVRSATLVLVGWVVN